MLDHPDIVPKDVHLMHCYISNYCRWNYIFNVLSGLLVLWWPFRTFPHINRGSPSKGAYTGLVHPVWTLLDVLKENCLLHIKSNYL